MSTFELETPRLLLRAWRDADRAPFAALNADPRVMEFFPNPLDRAASDAMADRIETRMAEHGWGLWAVEERGGAPFIGFVGLAPAPDPLPFAPAVEIGWRLAAQHWGQGYASEAASAALDFGFHTLHLAEIVSFTALVNTRSQAVMERIGMQRDPQTFEHFRIPEGHPLRTHCLYRKRARNALERER